jgi:transcriptional regulator with GAF, ATPase, and Fis domain
MRTTQNERTTQDIMHPTNMTFSATSEPSVGSVLSEIAAIASETLELQEVFDRVATSVRQVIPFDHMGVIRILEGQWAIKHATTLNAGCPAGHEPGKPGFGCPQGAPPHAPCSLTMWSPRMRPRPGSIRRIDDARVELDPSFVGDAEILKRGVRSTLWAPFKTGDAFGGGVWISSFHPRAFNDEHQEALQPIAALLGAAVEHWRIWDAEQRRRDRLDQIEPLLSTLATSLDVREIFERLSAGMQAILPHDFMVLTDRDRTTRTIRIIAYAGAADTPPPLQPVGLTEAELGMSADYEIVHDIPVEVVPNTERQRLVLSSGMRSWLRVPVFISGEVSGGLSFFHREASRFGREDAAVAARLADRIALMLSHQRLAEEARIAAEARERAERLEATVETLTRELQERGRVVVGASPSWKETLLSVGRVATSETTVLITGESGTGKEVISKLIHQGSPRSEKPFVAINCAALPEQLLESELFGHEKGAFTGAIATKIGRIEQAAGGTLFLDEIAEMSPLVQAKFLRVLEEREFQRVGGTRTLKADVRVIAATNRDLPSTIAKQAFREDLYYRLNVFPIHIAPLRNRPEDILPLAEAFLEDLGRTMGRPSAGISRDAREWLLAHPWPGNVRELRNAIERAILMCDGGLVTHDHFPAVPVRTMPAPAGNGNGGAPVSSDAPASNGMNLDDVERGLVEKALAESKGNKSRAARLLGLSRAQLYTRLDKHGIR